MNTDHKLGRAEAVRDMSRLIHDEVGKINNHITARTAELSDKITLRARELSTDEARTGYVSDDPKLQQLRAMRSAMDFIHARINRI